MSSEDPTVRSVDELGHDLLGATAETRRQVLDWLETEEAVGDLSPGLRALLEQLRAEED